MPDTANHFCRVCEHLFHTRHMDDDRAVATDDELQTGRCRDCLDCHPPEDAHVREDAREEVPA